MRLIRPATLVATLLIVFLLGCGAGEKQPPAARLQPTPSSPEAALKATAEQRYLPQMTPALAARMREQPWYESMTQAHLDMVALMQQCEKAAQRRGETGSVVEVLAFASEQAWYQDGLDEREALALGGVFMAYTESLSDDYAPPVGPVIARTLRSGLFDVVPTMESGQVILLVSAEDERLGRQVLDISRPALGEVEGLVGKFPFKFLYLEVADDLPVFIAGLSYDEFIALAEDAVDEATIVHEIAHSTLYGIFPTWFEEGFAHFIEYYLTENIPGGTREFEQFLRSIRVDTRLDLRGGFNSDLDELIERAQGFLFLKDLHAVIGIEGITKTVHSLRKQSATGQDLIRAMMTQTPVEKQPQLSQLICQRVLGTTRNYCV
jgi:hypothetical protein